MKKKTFIVLFILIIFAGLRAAFAADIDPILLDKPSPYVLECSENLFFEVLTDPIIEYNTGGRKAKELFLFFNAEFLFLEDAPWSGLDKNSFELVHIRQDGEEERFQLNYMMTSMMALKNGWLTFSDTLFFGTLLPLNLVFDVNTLDKSGWRLIFRPAERGGTPACEIEIPLQIKR